MHGTASHSTRSPGYIGASRSSCERLPNTEAAVDIAAGSSGSALRSQPSLHTL